MATGNYKYKIIDQSAWVTISNGYFRLLEANGIDMVILRLNFGARKDTKFDIWYDQFKAETTGKMKLGAYSWPNELYSGLTNLNYVRQFLGGREVDLIAADVESPIFSGSYSLLKNNGFAFYNQLKRVYGDKAVFYTGVNSVNMMGADSRWSTLERIWLALYYSRPPSWPPLGQHPWILPRYLNMNQIGMWQFSSKHREQLSSSDLDASVAWSEMDAFFQEETPVPPPDPEPPLEEPMKYIEVNVATLNVRTGPTTSYPAIFAIERGEKFFIRKIDTETTPGNIWVEIAPNCWTASLYNGQLLAKLFEV